MKVGHAQRHTARGTAQKHWLFAIFAAFAICALFALDSSASAQQQPPPALPSTSTSTSSGPPIDDVHSDRQELTDSQKTQHHIGHVELQSGAVTIFADDLW